MEAPFIRALLRTLLFAACIEGIFYRLLTIPSVSGWRWVEELHLSTSRAGVLMFMIAFALLLPTLLTIAYASLRAPAWPGGLNAMIAMGLLVLVAFGISSAVSPRGPAFAIGFTLLTATLSLVMLAGLYERSEEIAGRAFAVLLAGAILCMALYSAFDLAGRIAPFTAPFSEPALYAAARWLLIAAGLAAYPAYSPPERHRAGFAATATGVGVSTASAFALIFGAVAHPPFLSRIGSALGVASATPLSSVLSTGAAAAAVFLTILTASRCLGQPESKVRAYGLLFLLLAGFPHRIAYEHLLALAGVALVTASRPARIALSLPVPGFESRPAPDA